MTAGGHWASPKSRSVPSALKEPPPLCGVQGNSCFCGRPGTSDYIETRNLRGPSYGKEVVLMSDFELLYLAMTVIQIVIALIKDSDNAKK